MAYEFGGLNINWQGGGGFARDDWRFVRTVIQEHDIKTVLEYGCGLSTELMVAMGIDVLSLETQPQFFEVYNKAGFNVQLCDYDEGYPYMAKGTLPQIRERLHFDLGFIDGPGEQERHDRSKSVEHAMKRCKFVYLHDYGLGQFELLDNSQWWLAVTAYTERQSHLYIHNPMSGEFPDAVWGLANTLSRKGWPLSAEFSELAVRRAARSSLCAEGPWQTARSGSRCIS